jgi:hypothetical protein
VDQEEQTGRSVEELIFPAPGSGIHLVALHCGWMPDLKRGPL